MDQAIAIKGVRKLPGSLEGRDAAREGQGAEAAVPVDGRSVLFAYLDRETLVIAGTGEAFAGGMPAILDDDPKRAVPCTLVMLAASGQSGKKKPFVALLSLRKGGSHEPQRVTIRSQGHSYPFVLRPGPVDFKDLLERTAGLAQRSQADIVDSLVDQLLSPGAAAGSLEAAALLIRTVAGRDGCVEMLGRFDEGEVYVQGWAKGLPAGSSRVLLFDGALKVAHLCCGLFERKDTGGKAHGFAGLLESGEELDPAALRSISYRGRTGWSLLEVHEQRTLPAARALPGQVKALLPRLAVGGEGRSRLEDVANRFDGQETVSGLDVPVRVAVDFCVEIDRGGVLLSGWLLDPEDRVKSVWLRTAGRPVRLDTLWTSQPRPDVSAAFSDLSPFLSGPSARHLHGFLAFVPDGKSGGEQPAYLELVLDSGRSAYAPVSIGKAPLRAALKRLISGLDTATAFQSDIVERQFLPMLQSGAGPAPEVTDSVDLGPVADLSRQSIVVGLDGAFETVQVLLTLLAVDPLTRALPVVLAAPHAVLADRIEDVRRLAEFYRLPVRVALAAHADDRLDALEAGIAAAPTENVVCLAGGVLPRSAGWLAPLLAAFREREENCLVAPTVLYEDDTIRWAGAWIDQENGRHLLRQHYLGYPRRTLMGAEPCAVAAATFDCCILPKSALGAVGGFSRSYLGTDEKGLDAALKLNRSGLEFCWVPQVEMMHPEDDEGGERRWQALVSGLDRRTFEHVWAPVFASLAEEDI